MKICDIPGVHYFGICRKEHHHHHPRLKTPADYLVLISRIALGIIAAITSLTLFLPFFVGGIGWALHQLHHPASHAHHHHHDPFSVSGCGEYMQTISGMEFSPEASLIVNLSITICHIDHHPTVFVPYSAVSVGMWVGQLLDKPLTNLFSYFPSTASVA